VVSSKDLKWLALAASSDITRTSLQGAGWLHAPEASGFGGGVFACTDGRRLHVLAGVDAPPDDGAHLSPEALAALCAEPRTDADAISLLPCDEGPFAAVAQVLPAADRDGPLIRFADPRKARRVFADLAAQFRWSHYGPRKEGEPNTVWRKRSDLRPGWVAILALANGGVGVYRQAHEGRGGVLRPAIAQRIPGATASGEWLKSVDPALLADALAGFSMPVEMTGADERGPLVLRGPDKIALVMPMRTGPEIAEAREAFAAEVRP